MNITCDVDSNPPPVSYRWVVVKDDVNASTLRNHSHITIDTEDPVLEYQRPNDTVISELWIYLFMDGANTPGTEKLLICYKINYIISYKMNFSVPAVFNPPLRTGPAWWPIPFSLPISNVPYGWRKRMDHSYACALAVKTLSQY